MPLPDAGKGMGRQALSRNERGAIVECLKVAAFIAVLVVSILGAATLPTAAAAKLEQSKAEKNGRNRPAGSCLGSLVFSLGATTIYAAGFMLGAALFNPSLAGVVAAVIWTGIIGTATARIFCRP